MIWRVPGGRIEHARIQSEIGEAISVLLAFPLTERERRHDGAVAWRRRRKARRFKAKHALSQASVAGRLFARTEDAPSLLRGTDFGVRALPSRGSVMKKRSLFALLAESPASPLST